MQAGSLSHDRPSGPGPTDGPAQPANDEPININLLPFQQDIVEELLHNDGLTIMGKGLGLCTIAAALLMVHSATTGSGGVVVILGTHKCKLRTSFCKYMKGTVAAVMQACEGDCMYSAVGGVVCVGLHEYHR
jgi:hypothetical protein